MNINISYNNNIVKFDFQNIDDYENLGKLIAFIVSGALRQQMLEEMYDQIGEHNSRIVLNTIERMSLLKNKNAAPYIKPSEFTTTMINRGKKQ